MGSFFRRLWNDENLFLRVVAGALAFVGGLGMSGEVAFIGRGFGSAILALANMIAVGGLSGGSGGGGSSTLGRVGAVALFVGAASLPFVGCATATPREAWGAALTGYTAAAAGMALYCDLPEADAEACIKAAKATLVAEPIIEATQAAIVSGAATDEALERDTGRLKDLTPTVEGALP